MSLLTICCDIQERIGYYLKFSSAELVVKHLHNKRVKEIIKQSMYFSDYIHATKIPFRTEGGMMLLYNNGIKNNQ